MSDRTLLIDTDKLQLFMDGESGTWRLFLKPSFECIDLTLSELKELAADLAPVLNGVESDPETNNAEVRAAFASM